MSRIDGVGAHLAPVLTAAGVGTVARLAVTEPAEFFGLLHSVLAVTLPMKARLLLAAVAQSAPVPTALGQLPVATVAAASPAVLVGQLELPFSVVEEAHVVCGVLEICLDAVTLKNASLGDIVGVQG